MKTVKEMKDFFIRTQKPSLNDQFDHKPFLAFWRGDRFFVFGLGLPVSLMSLRVYA
jgi:hypothetical protein